VSPGSFFENELPIAGRPSGIFWCPDGIPQGTMTSLLSSRLGSSPFLRYEVARALRSFHSCLSGDAVLVTGSGMALEGALKRGSQLFAQPLLCLMPFPLKFNPSVAEEIASRTPVANEYRVFFETPDTPNLDSLVIQICQQVRVLSVRRGGNIHELMKRHGNAGFERDRSCVFFVLADERLTDPDLHGELRNQGVHDWWLYPGSADKNNLSHDPQDTVAVPLSDARPDEEICFDASRRISLESFEGDYLSHWTREPRDHWPDRSADNQWDTAFFSGDIPRGPVGTLIRILAQKKILASGRLVRDGLPVCSFTAVPLGEFPSRRKFRKHLARWDFEPFGIAIRRELLESLGARPVHYIRDESVSRISPSDDGWDVTDPKGEWEQEKEWRIAGDLDLRRIPPDGAAVFVPDETSAEKIAPWSRWPIVLLSGNQQGINRGG
jgi:hypothetical protein